MTATALNQPPTDRGDRLPATIIPTWADPVAVAGRAAEPVVELWNHLIDVARVPQSESSAPAWIPEPARRWLEHAIAPDAPTARAALLKMTGHIKVGRWLPFRAIQLIAPSHGFVWVARAGWGPLSFTGFDSYGQGEGRMRWLLGGRIPLVTATGADVTRSDADRVALDAVWLPQSFANVQWERSRAEDAVSAVRTIGHEATPVELRIGEEGRLTSVRMQRWSAPDKAPWGRYPCGGIVDAEATFDGVTIPSRIRVGYWIGTDRWAQGEFFRCEITDAVFLP
jgi:hypothetical protein